MNNKVRILLIAAIVVGLASCTAKQVRDAADTPDARAQERTAAFGGRSNGYRSNANLIAAPQTKPNKRLEEWFSGSGARIGQGAHIQGRRPVGPSDINLEFKDTDLHEVIRVILGNILKRNFVIDPNVTGKVALTTNRPLRRDELIGVLESILGSQGAKLVDNGGVYRITRSTKPATFAGGGIGIGGKTLAGLGNLRIFPLNFVTAEAMVKILKPLLPGSAIIHVDTNRNILIIGGTGPELRLAGKTVEIFDIDQMSDQKVLMIGLEHVNSKTIIAELKTIFGADNNSAGPAELIRFVPVERMNALLVMSTQKTYIEKARDWILRLDRPLNPSKRRIFVYYVQHGTAAKLAKGIREILGNGPVSPETSNSNADANQAPDETSANDVVRAQAAAPRLDILGEGIGVAVDEDRNALLVSATPKDFVLIEEVLARLDIRPLQVMVEVMIFEITLRDELRYGIQYALSNGGLGFSNAGTIGLSRNTTTLTDGNIITPLIAPLLPGFSFAIDGNSQTRFLIDTLSKITEVNVISSPNVLVLNHQLARLQVGDEVPIVTQTTSSTVTDNPLLVNTVQYRNTGVSLEVTPHINASGSIVLEIVQNVSDVSVTTSSNIDSPTIQNRSLVSTVNTRSGDTVMLGGLIREDSVAIDSGIPLLHELPIIGPLFGQKVNRANRTELVVLIRPVIASTPAETQQISKELQRKFHVLLQHEYEGISQPRRIRDDN